jgi:type II secretion system protein H
MGEWESDAPTTQFANSSRLNLPTFHSSTLPGFTLLELLVVIFIMVIMSGVVMASLWPALSEARLRSSASMTISALRYARSYAVTHRTEATVQFDTERQGLSVLIQETGEEGEESWRVITSQAGQFRALPGGIEIAEVNRAETTNSSTDESAETEDTVTFSALGQAEDIRITLSDERGNRRIIAVDAITGRCELTSDE